MFPWLLHAKAACSQAVHDLVLRLRILPLTGQHISLPVAIPSLAVSAGAESPCKACNHVKRCCKRNSILGWGEASLSRHSPSLHGSIHLPLLFQHGAFQTCSEAQRVSVPRMFSLPRPLQVLSIVHRPSFTQLAETILEPCFYTVTWTLPPPPSVPFYLMRAFFLMLCVILLFIRFLCLSQNLAHCLL